MRARSLLQALCIKKNGNFLAKFVKGAQVSFWVDFGVLAFSVQSEVKSENRVKRDLYSAVTA